MIHLNITTATNYNPTSILQSLPYLTISFILLTIIIYLSSKIVGLKSLPLAIASSTMIMLMNSIISSFNQFQASYILKLIIYLSIIKFIYRSSWSRSLFILIITYILSSLTRLITPTIPMPI
ncbi:MAG: hypothetical protein LM601_03640 [Candidatus Verstraetearchaeota archaeon]|nr:hypothetical protein [Candidatus Verstraetearchaeota archaeon]